MLAYSKRLRLPPSSTSLCVLSRSRAFRFLFPPLSLSWHLTTSCSLKAFKNNLATSGNYPCMRQGNGFSAVPRSSISVPRAHVHLGQRLRMRVLDAKLAMTPPVPHSLLLFFFCRSPLPSIFHALTYPHM